MSRYDAIVLGIGGVGSAAMFHLAARGARVLGLDRFPPGHDRGSSHGHTRIIRLAYFEHPGYVPLLRRAYQLWGDLERRSNRTLLHRVGLVQVGPAEGPLIRGVKASAAQHGLPLETLSPGEFAARLPGFRLPEGMEAVLEREAGYLMVEECVRAHVEQALALGAELEIGEAVCSWRVEGEHVVVETDRGARRADRLVVAAGAWAGQALAELRLPLCVRRKVLLWFEPHSDAYRAGPCFYYELPQGSFYGFPQLDARGVKLAEHSGGQPVDDPLSVDRSRRESDVAPAAGFVQQCLPRLSTRCVDHSVCLYTMTPDQHFIVDRHPRQPWVVLAAGLSGHGFKFTSQLGEALAELALGGKKPPELEFLRLGRPALVAAK